MEIQINKTIGPLGVSQVVAGQVASKVNRANGVVVRAKAKAAIH